MAHGQGDQLRILHLIPFLPYPPHGGSLRRIWEMVKFLGPRHDLTLVCLTAPSSAPEIPPRLAACCSRIYTAPVQLQSNSTPTLPDQVHYCNSPELRNLVAKLALETWDLVVLHTIHMAEHAHSFRAPVVLEEHNVESDLLLQQALLTRAPLERLRWRAQSLLLARYEESHWPCFAQVFAVSKIDQQQIQQRCPQARVQVIPNGCDTAAQLIPLTGGTRRLFFAGQLNYPPNLQAVQELLDQIMPRLWMTHPQTRLRLAGASAPRWLLDRMHSDERLEIYPNPSHMRDCVEGCSLLVVPLRSGGGSRLKILEALSWGLPVVTTGKGCEGLEVEDGVHLKICHEPEDFARTIADLESDPVAWESLRRHARELVERDYEWTMIFRDLESSLCRMRSASPCL